MTEEEFRKIIKEEIKPIHGEISRLNREFGDLQFDRLKVSPELRRLSTDMARVDSTLDSVTKDLSELKDRSDQDDVRWEGVEQMYGKITSTLAAHSASLMKIEKEIGAYNESGQINKKEIKQIEERLVKVESR